MYTQIYNWKMNYTGGCPDKRSVEDFLECENDESVRSFTNELTAVASGNADANNLVMQLGRERLVKHTSWEEWARTMLIWVSNYKNKK